MGIVGADLALKHGAIVDQLGKIIFTYENAEGMTSSLDSIYRRCQSAALAVPMDSIVVVDWDRDICSWGQKTRNAKVGTLLTLICWGFACLAMEKRKARIHFASPDAVRICLQLPRRASKEEVHAVTKHLLPRTLRGAKFKTTADLRGDCIDAWLLAFTYDCTRKLI